MVGDTFGLTVFVLLNTQSIMHIVFQLLMFSGLTLLLLLMPLSIYHPRS